MTLTLIERLRHYSDKSSDISRFEDECALFAEAADRIERLEGALREIVAIGELHGDAGQLFEHEIARAALGSSGEAG